MCELLSCLCILCIEIIERRAGQPQIKETTQNTQASTNVSATIVNGRSELICGIAMLCVLATTMLLGYASLFRPAVHLASMTPSLRSAPVMQSDANPFELATAQADNMMNMLGELDPPPSLLGLKQAVSSGDIDQLRAAQFELLVDQTLLYDTAGDDETGMTLVPTTATMAQDDEITKEKMRYVYSYGIKMFMAGFLKQENLQEIVIERLAKKVTITHPP